MASLERSMTNKALELDTETLIEFREMGLTDREIGNEMGCSSKTISRRIAAIQADQSILLQYRTLQSLQLTELQARVLEAITPDKINNATLHDLVYAFKILKDKEMVLEGGKENIKGLVAYLIELEKEEAALGKTVEAEFEEIERKPKEITDPNYTPKVGG